MPTRSRNAESEWEIVRFVSAELISAGRYKLTTLLRGQRGSEHTMADPVAAGARVLVLTTALGQPGISEAEVGLLLTWRAGPGRRAAMLPMQAGHRAPLDSAHPYRRRFLEPSQCAARRSE